MSVDGQQALKTSEELFGTAFHNSPMGICITILDGRLQNISQSLLDILGFTRAELEGRHFNDITHPDDRKIGEDDIGRMMSGKMPSVSFEKRYLHKNGEPIWALVSSYLLRDSCGQPVHFITHILNMTERKQAEKQLRQSEQNFSRAFNSSPTALMMTHRAANCITESGTLGSIVASGIMLLSDRRKSLIEQFNTA